jgi:hypothetical protein
MSDKEIKVTDKRMFTHDGELKEEYRFLDEIATAPPESSTQPSAEPPAERRAVPPPAAAPPAAPLGRGEPPAALGPGPQRFPEGWQPSPEGSPLELPGAPPELGAPTFFDLVAVLAEPVAVYLGDVDYDGQSAENLEMARLHIDLLDVLRQKTAGNLTAQEAAFLDDLLYRLRVRYVQKRG